MTHHRLHHFLTEAPGNPQILHDRRLRVMKQCNQTKIRRGFTLIIDDSGHRKNGLEQRELADNISDKSAKSIRFVRWLEENMDVFTAYKDSLGLI